MKIAHVIASVDISHGGPSRSATHLIAQLSSDFPEDFFSLHTNKSPKPIISSFKNQKTDLKFYDSRLLYRLKGLKSSLEKFQPDILHGQGIWDLPINQMANIARGMNKPYVITPRGMLEPWSLRQKRLKKWIALQAYQLRDLKEATCIHATAEMEAESIRSLGVSNPIAIIPNGIPLQNFPSPDPSQERLKKILFLSRIHEKKGIEFLIEAWATVNSEIKKNWTVEIVGNGKAEYINKLKKIINVNGLTQTMKINPPVYGSEKVKVYQEASLFVLPTYSENYGVVIAEALACGTPVITTKGAPWSDLNSYKCGQWIGIGAKPLVKALENMLSLDPGILKEMGGNGRKLIEEKYSIDSVANKMHNLYKWLHFKTSKPDFLDS